MEAIQQTGIQRYGDNKESASSGDERGEEQAEEEEVEEEQEENEWRNKGEG